MILLLTLPFGSTYGTPMNKTLAPFEVWPFLFQLTYMHNAEWDEAEVILALMNGEDEERTYIDSLPYWN